MSVHAFKMQLKPGVVAEYRKRHDEIWPELSALLTESGIHDYSIFLDEDTLSLFAVLKLRADNSRDALPDHPVRDRACGCGDYGRESATECDPAKQPSAANLDSLRLDPKGAGHVARFASHVPHHRGDHGGPAAHSGCGV